jgi:hypothetical protein
MSRSTRLSVALAAAIGVTTTGARAQESACAFVEWGFGYMKVEDRGQAWTYSLETPGPMWRAEGAGYHAPGWLSCDGCSARGKGAGGLYYFITPSDEQNPPTPPTAAERAARSTEWFGYPPMRFTSHHLDVEGTREGLSVGPLSGYAVLYKVSLKDQEKDWAEGGLNDQRGLLVVHLMDGCMSFNTAIATDRTGNKDVWAPLDDQEDRYRRFHAAGAAERIVRRYRAEASAGSAAA